MDRSLLQVLYQLKEGCTVRAVGIELGRTHNEMMDLPGYIERILSFHDRASRCHREGNSFEGKLAIFFLDCDLSHGLVQKVPFFRGCGVQSFQCSSTDWKFLGSECVPP